MLIGSVLVCGVSRFHRLKTELGISKLISRDVFSDAANGYLINDKCVFGVEVFVLDSKFEEEYLRPLVEVDNKTFTWTIADFSNLSSEMHYSDEFYASSFKWLFIFLSSFMVFFLL